MYRILYFDDNSENVSLFNAAVLGFERDVDFIGIDNLEDFNSFLDNNYSCDLYIVDYYLEDCSGLDVAKILRDRLNSFDLIVISAGSIRDIKKRFKDSGFQPVFIGDRIKTISFLRSYIR
jgi:response regulator of citrate/malate metabolism